MFSLLTNQQEQLGTISWSYQAPVRAVSYSPAAWKLMLSHPMDKGAWRATVNGVARVGHNLAAKPPTKCTYYHFITFFQLFLQFSVYFLLFVSSIVAWWFSLVVLCLDFFLFGFYSSIICFWFVIIIGFIYVDL